MEELKRPYSFHRGMVGQGGSWFKVSGGGGGLGVAETVG